MDAARPARPPPTMTTFLATGEARWYSIVSGYGRIRPGSLFPPSIRMKRLLQSTLLMLAMATPAVAATSTDFYLTLLRRGTAEVDAGRHADATMNLRLAAFGLLDSIEH